MFRGTIGVRTRVTARITGQGRIHNTTSDRYPCVNAGYATCQPDVQRRCSSPEGDWAIQPCIVQPQDPAEEPSVANGPRIPSVASSPCSSQGSRSAQGPGFRRTARRPSAPAKDHNAHPKSLQQGGSRHRPGHMMKTDAAAQHHTATIKHGKCKAFAAERDR